MRTTHANLVTAQQAASTTPYIYLSINSTNYWSRLLELEHIEEPYRDRAVIDLDNHDRALDPGTLDLRGKPFSIGYGYTYSGTNYYCGDGNGTAGTPTLWVKDQSVISVEGKCVCRLYCEGMWMMLRELLYIAVGDAPYYEYQYGGTQTIKEIITLALAQASMTLNATFEDDGIVNDFKPYFTSRYDDSLGSLLYRLIQMTKCYLRPEASSVFKIIYPQAADSVNETYYSDQAPYFLEYDEQLNLLVPNDIKVFWGADDDGTWTSATAIANLANPGSATDTDSIAAYTTVRRVYIVPEITNITDANNRAAAILARFKAETLAGRLVLPFHDCRVELYDRVSIQDQRGY